MNGARFLGSSIGQKVVMAVTGLILFAFVVGHMIGNLQVYLGPEALNAYGAFLRHMLHGAGIWVARSVLLVSVGLHIWAATTLTLASWKARPVGYRKLTPQASDYASRTMRWSGPLLAIFILYHLAHLTLGATGPAFKEGDVYHNVIAGFSLWPISAFYIVAMMALGLHMFHGVWSLLQTLGLSHPRLDPLRKSLAALFTALVVLGNISIPVSVLTGLIR